MHIHTLHITTHKTIERSNTIVFPNYHTLLAASYAIKRKFLFCIIGSIVIISTLVLSAKRSAVCFTLFERGGGGGGGRGIPPLSYVFVYYFFVKGHLTLIRWKPMFYVHFEHKNTSQSLSNFCIEQAPSSVKFDNDCDVIFMFKM